MMTSILILAGIVLLSVGGESLIRGSLAAAHYLHISPLLSGLIIVGFGTSAPELVVSVHATINQQPDIALGNIIGSNIGNIFLILGICALITPLAVKAEMLRRDAVVVVSASVLFVVLAIDGELAALEGAILLTALLAYIFWVYRGEAKRAPAENLYRAEDSEISTLPKSPWLIVVFTVGGLLLLIIGSRLLLRGALNLADYFQVSSSAIGVTLVAIGTSIPEISVSVIATFRRHADVAIGNVLGSNLFNLLGILGLSSLLQSLQVSSRFYDFDQWVMLAAAAAILPMMYTGYRLSRIEGMVLLSCYAAYVWLGFTLYD